MIKYLINLTVLSLSFVFISCVTNQEKSRAPSSEITVLSDKYGDAKVYFCGEEMAVVTVDPNKCGEARATRPGSGCTEMAGYKSKPLTIIKNNHDWDLVDKSGNIQFRVSNSENKFHVSSANDKRFNFQMTWYALTERDMKMFKFIPICP